MDVNLNGEKDGVRMTWPRAFTIATFLVVAGVAGARFEFMMKDQQRQITDQSRSIDQLTGKVDQLTALLYDLRKDLAAPIPEIDSKGRIKK